MDKRHELIKEWIHKADHDLGMAKLALEKGSKGSLFYSYENEGIYFKKNRLQRLILI
jgi:HEPN domain-containing protein